jgi:hypothetical protein
VLILGLGIARKLRQNVIRERQAQQFAFEEPACTSFNDFRTSWALPVSSKTETTNRASSMVPRLRALSPALNESILSEIVISVEANLQHKAGYRHRQPDKQPEPGVLQNRLNGVAGCLQVIQRNLTN